VPQNPLPFSIQGQNCTEWCWAAVVSSIAQFVKSAQPPQQCQVVDREAFSTNFPSPGCCNPTNSCKGDPNRLCNRPGSIGRALAAFNLTADSSGQTPGPADFSTIVQQIDQSCVVVFELSDVANPALTHVVVAYGHSGTDDLMIADPADASCKSQSYSALLNPGQLLTNFPGWQLTSFFTTVPRPS